jgi:hypothetical protein
MSAKQIAAEDARQREAQDRKEQIRDLWQRLHMVVEDRAGTITTAPYHWPVRLEVFPESGLPVKLAQLGYVVSSKGQITRIGPPRSKWDASPFRVMDAFDVDLPSGGR